MAKCTRIGCGATFDPANNTAADCRFHTGAPLFHEGLKSYTCCSETNKPVMSFDEFMKIPGCTTGSHSSEKSEVKAPVVTANVQESMASISLSGQNGEYSTSGLSSSQAAARADPVGVKSGPTTWKERPVSPAISTASGTNGNVMDVKREENENDPEGAVIPEGSRCKRAGCTSTYTSAMSRADEECQHHPLPAIFHEGSKGYACCKRRVLEFDEFLKIEGCKRAKHCFVGSQKQASGEEEYVQCRHDMYQTPRQVVCSVYGKQADKEQSTVKFEEWTMHVDLRLPGSKRFAKSFALYGPIDVETSSYRILGTKVEVSLQKADGRSWPTLEAPAGDVVPEGKYGAPQITFGVQGRTGTVGAKQMIYAGDVVQHKKP